MLALIIASLVLGYLAIAVCKLCIKLLPLILVGGACCLGFIILAVSIDSGDKPRCETSKAVRTVSDVIDSNIFLGGTDIRAKAGVNLSTLRPEMEDALLTIVAAYKTVLGDEYIPTITSGDDYDGHMEGSAHYSGAALDFRLKDIEDPYQREMVAYAVREGLGEKFFVDHENPGEDNEHLHVQMRRGTYGI